MSEIQQHKSPKKPSKLEQLQVHLARAKAELEEKRSALEVEIRAWEADRAQLSGAADKASKAARRAWDNYAAVVDNARTEVAAAHPQLRDQLVSWATAQHLKHADTLALVRKFIENKAATNEQVVNARATYDALDKASKKATHAYNVKYNNTVCPARRKLDELAEYVADLEGEIRRVPQRNQVARERRAEERAAEQEEKDTRAALVLLDSFEYKTEGK